MKKRMICMLTTLVMCLGTLPVTAYAENGLDVQRDGTIEIEGGKIDATGTDGSGSIGGEGGAGGAIIGSEGAENPTEKVVAHGESVVENEEIISVNNGTVKDNNVTGTVVTNGEDAWVNTNYGMVNTNNGLVSENCGTVETNNGKVRINAGIGSENGTIEINKGTVECNNGIVGYNYGTVGNYGSTVRYNYGTVENYGGTVKYNYGTVTNNGGTVLYNLGGTVKGDNFTDYFKLEGLPNQDLQISGESENDVMEHNGVYWLKKDGTAIITPSDKEYYLTELTVAGGNVSQNSDGSFAVTSDGGAVTIGDMEMLAVRGGEVGVDYTFVNGALYISKSGNYTLSGKAKGIAVSADGQVNLTFDGVEVTAPESGVALEVNSGTVNIQLKAGTENKLDGGITIEESIRNQMGVKILVDGSMAISGKVDDLVPIIPGMGMRMEVKVGADADTAKAVAGSPFSEGRLLKTEDIDLSDATNVVELKGYDYVYFGEAPDTPAPTPKKRAKKYDVIIEQAKNGDVKVNDDYAKRGQEITITVKPDKGYELDELVIIDQYDDEVDYDEGKKENTFIFDMPKSDVTIEASFEKADDAEETEETPAEQEEQKPVTPAAVQKEILLTIGSRLVQLDDKPVVTDAAPIIKGERTFLPIRFIAEELGADVTWDAEAQSVTITKGDLEIVIFIGQPYALVNGERVALDAPAFIENGRTYLPLRFVAENLGAEVIWNSADKTVIIRSGE